MAKKKPAQPPAASPSEKAGATSKTRRKLSVSPPRLAESKSAMVLVDLGSRGTLGGAPAEVARELCRLADDEESVRNAEKLLKQAEGLDAQCALVPLARGDRAKTATAALKHYQRALEMIQAKMASHRKQGQPLRRSSEDADDFQAVHRAIASALESERRLVEAIPHYEAVLKVRPDDSDTVESLALALLSAQKVTEAADLVARSDAPSYFTKALVEFRRSGPTPVAGHLLRRGHSENPHVAPLLLGESQFDEEIPDDLSPGSFGAAELYLLRAMPAWRDAPGAITWLREILGGELDSPKPRLKERRAHVQDLLKQIRGVAEPDVEPWRLSVRALHPGVPSELGQLSVLTNEMGDTLYQSTVFDEIPNTETMLELLLETAQERKVRPTALLFDDQRLLRRIEAALQSMGIETRLVDRSPRLDRSIEDLRGQIIHSLDQTDADVPEDLDRLPASDDVWLVDAQRLPRWVQNTQHRFVRLHSIMVVSKSQGVIVSQRIETAEEKLPAMAWQTVARAMTHPFAGSVQRPAEVRVRTHDLRVALEPHLKPLGVRCVVTGEFAIFDEAHNILLKSLAEDTEEKDDLSLVNAGHKLGTIENLFRQACHLHRAAPWKSISPDRVIEVRGGRWRKARYAVVIGQSGLLQGLCLYDTRKDLDRAMAVQTELDDVNVLNLFFDEPQALPIDDHDAYLDHNWPVASPEGYPLVMRIRRRSRPQAPTPEELEMLSAVAGVIPEFIDAGPGEQVIDSSAGKLTLAWLDEEADQKPKRGKKKKD